MFVAADGPVQANLRDDSLQKWEQRFSRSTHAGELQKINEETEQYYIDKPLWHLCFHPS